MRLILILLLAIFCFVFSETIEVKATEENKFDPTTVTIKVGDTVRWTNLADDHNVAQVEEPFSSVRSQEGFFSGEPGTVDVFEYTFNTSGNYFYVCERHASIGMVGEVIVENGNSTNQ